jgi:hypothetical protein
MNETDAKKEYPQAATWSEYGTTEGPCGKVQSHLKDTARVIDIPQGAWYNRGTTLQISAET